VPDDPHIARVEERVEQLVKRLDRHELAMERALDVIERVSRQQFVEMQQSTKDQFVSLEKLLREAIGSAITAIEAKNVIVRTVVLGMCGVILLAFLNWTVAEWKGPRPNFVPTLPPAHSSKEIRQ
jgi:hypothetical protein